MKKNNDFLSVMETLELLPIRSRTALYAAEGRGWITSRRDYRNYRIFRRMDVLKLRDHYKTAHSQQTGS